MAVSDSQPELSPLEVVSETMFHKPRGRNHDKTKQHKKITF